MSAKTGLTEKEMAAHLKTERERLELLYNLLRYTLTRDTTPTQVGEQALDLIMKSFTILRGEIFALNRQRRLVLLAIAGYEEANLSDLRFKVEQRLQQSLVHKVQQTGQAIIIPDVNCQEYWLPIPHLDEEICSIAALPLKADGQVIGILSLLSDQKAFFQDGQIPLLTAVANTVALVLQNVYLFEQVRTGQEQLRWLTEQLVNLQEEERRRVSHTLHDEAGQALTILHLSLNAIRGELPPESPAHKKVEDADTLLTETMARIRRLAYDLRPPELDTLGLNVTLESLCQEFNQHAQFEVSYHGETTISNALPDRAKMAFYRFLQEALTNAAKHADATHVNVSLDYDGEKIALQVADNGRGFDLSGILYGRINQSKDARLGLLGMSERFDSLDGKLDMHSTIGEGTTLTATVPWSK